MRRFGTQGRVYPEENYVVARTEEIADFINRVKEGRYIVLFAPRQTGKTTFFHSVLEALVAQDSIYFPIQLNFEAYADYDLASFYASLHREICEEIRRVFQKRGQAPSETLTQFLVNTQITDHLSMRDFFQEFDEHLAIHYNNSQRVILFMDAFHGIPLALENSFLASLRSIYLTHKPHCPHSVCFVSVRSIIQRDMINTVSPFNIQDAFHLSNFTFEQVRELLIQYTEKVGQAFEPAVVKSLHKQAAGQPFLVNRLAEILTEEMEILKTEPITMEYFSEAYTRILQEHNANFDHLLTYIRRSPQFEGILTKIMSHSGRGVLFDHYDERIDELATNGIISESNYGTYQIANPIYSNYIKRVFSAQSKELGQESFS